MPVMTIAYNDSRRQQANAPPQLWGRRNVHYEKPFEQPRRFARQWQLGEIAFLKPEDAFTADEHKTLIQPSPGSKHGYLPAKATGHPVIMLSSPTEKSTHVLVTPVSAYSSGDFNDFLPPWRQDVHKWKRAEDFRSFHGCERYSDEYPYLHLEAGKSMPKPRASWLYIQSLWVVPLTVIGRFTKTRDFFRMREDSVDSLLAHMKAKCRRWRDCIAELEAHERAAHGLQDSSPARISTWRRVSNTPGPRPWGQPPVAASRRYNPPPTSRANVY